MSYIHIKAVNDLPIKDIKEARQVTHETVPTAVQSIYTIMQHINDCINVDDLTRDFINYDFSFIAQELELIINYTAFIEAKLAHAEKERFYHE